MDKMLIHKNVEEYYSSITTLLTERIDDFLPRDNIICPWIREILMGGKRIRSFLTLLSFQAVGGELENGIGLAFAVELTHNATLVHDDIVDNDTLRRGQKSLHEISGLSNAIVIGDAMISIAVNISSQYGTEINRILSRYGFDLCCGEFLDINSSIDNTDEYHYMLRIKKKSASLFRASTHAGALAGNGSEKEVNALANFGEYIGIAYQIRDDIHDMKAGNDLKKGIVTLPIIHLYEKSDDKTREFLMENFGRADMNRTVVEEIIELMDQHGSFEYCNYKLMESVHNAKSSLKNLRNSEFKQYLLEVPEFILTKNESKGFDAFGP